jgi:hypothetical protein
MKCLAFELLKKRSILIRKQQFLKFCKSISYSCAFKFPGTDKVLDELTKFIKTERECCDFFTFNLSISGDKSKAWLELTGIDGAKDFISTELGLTDRNERRAAHNSRFAKAGVSCFYDSEVLNSSFVLLINFSAENPRLRKAAKRQSV